MSVTLKLHDDDAWKAAKAMRIAALAVGSQDDPDLNLFLEALKTFSVGISDQTDRELIGQFRRLASAFETAVKANEK